MSNMLATWAFADLAKLDLGTRGLTTLGHLSAQEVLRLSLLGRHVSAHPPLRCWGQWGVEVCRNPGDAPASSSRSPTAGSVSYRPRDTSGRPLAQCRRPSCRGLSWFVSSARSLRVAPPRRHRVSRPPEPRVRTRRRSHRRIPARRRFRSPRRRTGTPRGRCRRRRCTDGPPCRCSRPSCAEPLSRWGP